MPGDTWFLKPLAKAADGNAGSLPNGGIAISETGLNEGPDMVHQRSHELAASFNRHTESKHSASSVRRLRGSEKLEDEKAQGVENLVRREVGGKTVDDAESGL